MVTDGKVTGIVAHPTSPEEWTDAFLAFADSNRRRLLLVLWERGPDAGSVPLREVPAFDAEHALLELRHVHLPALEEAGYVRWDRDRNAVERGPRYGEVVPLVEWFRERRSLGEPV